MERQTKPFGEIKMSTLYVESGDTLVVTDQAGIQYTLHDVFFCGSNIEHFEPEDGEGVLPSLDVTLSSFEFHVDSGNNEEVEE